MIPLKLKNTEIDQRKEVLKLKLDQLNNWIINDLRSYKDNGDNDNEVKFHGVMIPLCEEDSNDPSIVVNIVVDLAKSFNTNKRSPILVVFLKI